MSNINFFDKNKKEIINRYINGDNIHKISKDLNLNYNSIYNHIDEIKNIKENLKKMENIQKKINQYSIDGEFIKTWDSVKEAGHSLGIRRAFISSVLTGVKKSAKGFKFTYYEQ